MTVDFSKLTTIGEIKNAKDGNKDVFTEEEKRLFEGSLRSDIEQAQKAAELLVRIKKANEEKKPNPKLIEDLEDEKEARYGRGSIVYRALNINGLVEKTIDYLVFIGRTDLPKDKTARQAKITEIEKEISEKRVERVKNNKSVTPLENQLKGLLEDRKEVEKIVERKNSLLALLGGNPTGAKISHNGSEKLLNEINITDIGGIQDYADPANPVADNTHTTVADVVTYAEGFYNAIRENYGTPPPTYKTSLPTHYFNNRTYQNKVTLTHSEDGIGFTVLKALREVGLPKLEGIIDDLNDSNLTGGVTKSDLKKYAKEIVEGRVNWENFFALINNIFPLDSDEIIFVHGFAEEIPAGKTSGWYAAQPTANPVLKEQVKKGSQVAKDADFNEKIAMDYEFENGQNMLRFCLTMRELFYKLGISSSIDEFDDYLLELISEREIDVNLDRDTERKGALDSEIEILQKKIGDIRGKNAEIDAFIASKKLEIDALKELEEISDKPLPDKKAFFDNLYAKKSSDGK
ncbi:9101_t:CDS:2 [Ambispora leptoticha]|uniref:9101_t:CDS:1 n=1 Tax=Ambispora leptoticha TaxID=144679 RepID=A0A9N9C0T4_9GLOM|nr:9101_t:CDS:2 [Ambispora leptoticha]